MSMMSELRDHSRLGAGLVFTVDDQGAQKDPPERFSSVLSVTLPLPWTRSF